VRDPRVGRGKRPCLRGIPLSRIRGGTLSAY